MLEIVESGPHCVMVASAFGKSYGQRRQDLHEASPSPMIAPSVPVNFWIKLLLPVPVMPITAMTTTSPRNCSSPGSEGWKSYNARTCETVAGVVSEGTDCELAPPPGSLCDLSRIYACSMIPSSVLFEKVLVHSSIRSRILDFTCGCVVWRMSAWPSAVLHQ